MELYATTAVWDGGKLTVYDKTQGVQNVQRYLCSVFDNEVGRCARHVAVHGRRLRLRPASAVSGGTGGARRARAEAPGAPRAHPPANVLAGLSSGDASSGLTLGAKADGTLDCDDTRGDRGDLAVRGVLAQRHRMGRAALQVPQHEVRAQARAARLADLVRHARAGRGDRRLCARVRDGRARGGAQDRSARIALECYSDRDQNDNLPYTSKRLRECYSQGAEAFGWDKRNPAPRSMRDGTELVGWGMATGVWEALQMPIAVRIVLTANGHAEVSCATSDIGTGTYTIMAQVAADMLRLAAGQYQHQAGQLDAAAIARRRRIMDRGFGMQCHRHARRRGAPGAAAAGQDNAELAACRRGADDVALADGKIMRTRDGAAVSIADAMRHGKVDRIEQQKANKFDKPAQHAHNTHSAIFAEVKIDEQLGVIRVTRVVNAVAAGRILNAKTAHSQIMGSVVWGIGMALHEETLFDHRFGRIMNANIAEYHVPVNADVHDIEVIFVDEPDEIINPLGIKGLGEIGIVGVAAAIANAVYHATGKRVRDLPITLDKLRRSLLSRRSSRPSCSTAQLDRCPLLAQSELFQRVRLTSGFGCAGASNPGAE